MTQLEILPYFDEEAAVIVVTPHKGFSGSLSVLVQSIIENSQIKKKYDILVLHRELEGDVVNRIEKQVAVLDNIHIRFFDIDEYTKQFDFFSERVTPTNIVATYYRLIIPELLQNYDKAIYLDADIIVLRDIWDLWKKNIDEFLLGAVEDYAGNWEANDLTSDLCNYRKDTLSLKKPAKYFNAGVLMLNLKKFREKYSLNYILEVAQKKRWRCKDQDILNYLVQEEVFYLDYGWNLIMSINTNAETYMDKEVKEKFEIAKSNPYLVHFAGRFKPWNYFKVPFSNVFWEYASKTCFLEELENQIGNGRAYEMLLEQIKDGKVGVKQIFGLLVESLKYRYIK